MDRSVYIAMTGATQTMRAQDAVSHDLANASTVGFKSELAEFQSLPVLGCAQLLAPRAAPRDGDGAVAVKQRGPSCIFRITCNETRHCRSCAHQSV